MQAEQHTQTQAVLSASAVLLTNVTFQVEYRPSGAAKEDIYICGSCIQIGNWDVSKSIPLTMQIVPGTEKYIW
jgi:hypothetical protein